MFQHGDVMDSKDYYLTMEFRVPWLEQENLAKLPAELVQKDVIRFAKRTAEEVQKVYDLLLSHWYRGTEVAKFGLRYNKWNPKSYVT